MKAVRKDPLRFSRYTGFLLWQEFIRGDADRRRRFVARILWRCERLFGLYAIAAGLFMIFHAGRCAFLPPEDRARQWRQRRWMWAISGLENHPYLKSWTMSRYENVPKVVITGMGSIGDVLQITPVLRTLRERLPGAEICLLHRCAAAKDILYKNPHINSVAWADFYTFAQIKKAVATGGGADLILDIESAKYIVTYARAPKACRSPRLDALLPESFFAKAEAGLSIWHGATTTTRGADGSFSWPEERKHYHYLDVLGTTGNLPIDRYTPLDFSMEPDDSSVLHRLPRDVPIITVQNGVDCDVVNWTRVVDRRPTKLLPRNTWGEIVPLLQEKGFCIVQLGAAYDEAIEGVSFDLRGQTTLREAAAVLKEAFCHVGTEGGLTHLARAVETKSVVLFGPTAVEFFGYPQNINLTVGTCGACWLSAKDWYIYCPRGLDEPECMTGHRAETIMGAVSSLRADNEREHRALHLA